MDTYIDELPQFTFGEQGKEMFIQATNGEETGNLTIGSLVDSIWEKMYNRPVIVQCSYCNCHNAFSNVACVQCGAPMGEHKHA